MAALHHPILLFLLLLLRRTATQAQHNGPVTMDIGGLRSCASCAYPLGINDQLSCELDDSNACFCRSDLQSVAVSYIASCVADGCSSDTVDVQQATNLYLSYCTSNGYFAAATTAFTQTPSPAAAATQSTLSNAVLPGGVPTSRSSFATSVSSALMSSGAGAGAGAASPSSHSSPASPPTGNHNSNSNSNKSVAIGAGVGAGLGSFLAIIAVAALIFISRRRRRRRDHTNHGQGTPVGPPYYGSSSNNNNNNNSVGEKSYNNDDGDGQQHISEVPQSMTMTDTAKTPTTTTTAGTTAAAKITRKAVPPTTNNNNNTTTTTTAAVSPSVSPVRARSPAVEELGETEIMKEGELDGQNFRNELSGDKGREYYELHA